MIWEWDLNPVLVSVAGLDIRWYGLAYLAGVYGAYLLVPRIGRRLGVDLSDSVWENLVLGAFLCGILGGRVGYFLFYDLARLLSDPLEIFAVWHGGMSIHGGIIGSVLFLVFFARRHRVPVLRIFDTSVIPLALALIFGRLANFVNGELVGEPTDQTWGVIFPHVDDLLRHPSQIYEMFKNIILSSVLAFAFWRGFGKYIGGLTMIFVIGYGVLRFGIEFFRAPTVMVGVLSMGQILCLGMILFGIGLGGYIYRREQKRV